MIHKSTNNVEWVLYQPGDEFFLKEIREYIPKYGMPDARDKEKSYVADMKVIPEKITYRTNARVGKEHKTTQKPTFPRVGIPLYAETRDAKGNLEYWRWSPNDNPPKQEAVNTNTLKWVFPVQNKNYKGGKIFTHPSDTDELWFLITKSVHVQNGKRPTTKTRRFGTSCIYYFDVPEVKAKNDMVRYKQEKEFCDTIMLGLGEEMVNTIHRALGLVEVESLEERRFEILRLTKEGKDHVQKQRVMNLIQSRKFRSEMVMVGDLISRNLIKKEPNGWFIVQEMQEKGNKANPFAKYMEDAELSAFLASNDKVRDKLQKILNAELTPA